MFVRLLKRLKLRCLFTLPIQKSCLYPVIKIVWCLFYFTLIVESTENASSWLILINKYTEMHGQQNIKKSSITVYQCYFMCHWK